MPAGRKREFDRDVVLDAALNAFWEKGFEATTYDDLVAATGVNRPSLYAAFGDKGALFEAALKRYIDANGAPAIDRIVNGKGSARKVIGDWLRATADRMTGAGHPPGCLVAQTHAECGAPQDRRRIAKLGIRRTEEALRHRLEAALEAGESPPGADPAALSRTLMAVNLGMATMARNGATRDDLRQVAENAIALIPAAGTDTRER